MMTAQDAAVTKMRVSEIKRELDSLSIDYKDCFDKESMVKRLLDAREGKVEPKKEVKVVEEQKSSSSSSSSSDVEFNAENELEEIRAMSVRDLREELGRRQISRSGLLEKEDLIQALLKAREQASVFSATGVMTPGKVSDLTGEQVEAEMKHTSTPLLLDCYATWCGPCQMMVKPFEEVAAELGSKVRLAKMDTDKHPQVAGQLRVQGLPTLVLFQNGQEIDRIEGALMKDQLLQWIDSKL
jgi:thioredoxin 2